MCLPSSLVLMKIGNECGLGDHGCLKNSYSPWLCLREWVKFQILISPWWLFGSIKNIPMACLNAMCATFLGKMIGHVLAAEVTGSKMRVKVCMQEKCP